MSEVLNGRKVNSFQMLRGICALFIIFEHVEFMRCGVFAVDIFFVLSGFMIMYSTRKGMEGFMVKRLIRIVPFYWLMTFVTFLGVNLMPGAFESTRAGVKELLLSLFFIPFDMNSGYVLKLESLSPVVQPLMRIGWTLNMEMFFYLLFFIASKINYRFRALITTIFIGLAIVLSLIFISPIGILLGSLMMIEFVFGMGLYYLCMYVERTRVTKPVSYAALSVTVVLFIFLAVCRANSYLENINRLVIWGVPAFVIVLCAYLYERNLKPVKALVWAGDISFSIYYVHYYVVKIVVGKVFKASEMSVKGILSVVVAVFVTLILSSVTYELIEKRFTGFLRRTLTK